MSSVMIERLGPNEVTPELTGHLQDMALGAWSQLLPERSRGELLHLFNPTNPDHLAKARAEYQSFAEQEGLLVAMPKEDGKAVNMPVGFLLTKEDISGSIAVRAFKRQFHPGRVYALIKHVVVAPEMQRKGIAKQLAAEALATYKPEQVPTAYIFDEHPFAMSAILKYGYVMAPIDQQPEPRYVFGADTSPAYQYRFAAVDAGQVIERLSAS